MNNGSRPLLLQGVSLADGAMVITAISSLCNPESGLQLFIDKA